jgi:hypothetical protein
MILLNLLFLVGLIAIVIGLPMMVIGSQAGVSLMTSSGFLLLAGGFIFCLLSAWGTEAIENMMPSRGDCMPRC